MKSETFKRIQFNDDGFKVYSSDYEFFLYTTKKNVFFLCYLDSTSLCLLCFSDNGPDLVLLIVWVIPALEIIVVLLEDSLWHFFLSVRNAFQFSAQSRQSKLVCCVEKIRSFSDWFPMDD